jgi:hypothetical protein
MKLSIFLFPLLILLTAASLYPQGGVNGAIGGFVTDPSGAAVAGMAVKVTNVNTGVSYRAGTTTEGYYTVKFLIPGTYRVEVSQTGFQRAVVEDVVVQTASNPTVNVKLTLGTVAQTITVTDKTSMVEAQTADSGTIVDTKRVDDTPTQQRNMFGLTYASAGVLPTSNMRSYTPFDTGGSSAQSINGSNDVVNSPGSASNEMLVDGVENRTSYDGATFGYIPTQETVSEVKVITNPYSAEYGHTLGGAILAETKSGTNQFHGQLFEFNRSHGLASNTFARNLAGQPKLPLLFNTFGGQIGGPIKKNKVFFFFSYEGIDNHSATAEMGNVPTAQQRQGDFSQTYYNSGTAANPVKTPITLYNPFSCTSTTTTCTSRTVIGSLNDSVIPSNLMDPIATNFWKYINQPNAPGDPITQANNYFPTNNGAAIGRLSEYTTRVDYNINNNSRITLRAIRENYNSYNVKFYTLANDVAEVSGSYPFTRANNNDLIDYTRTFSPTSVLDIRLGMERYFTQGIEAMANEVTPAQLGFSSLYASQAAASFPAFSFGGSYLGSTNFTGGGTSAGNIQPEQVNTLTGTFLKSIGRHTLRFGGEGVLDRYYNWSPGYNAGQFSFSAGYAQQNPLASSSASQGNPVAAFEMGVGAVSINVNSMPARQNLRAAWFVQDDIRVTRKLTINAGLRWDWDGGLTDRFNAITGPFATNVANPLATQVASAAGASNCPACANLLGGLVFPGVNGISRSPYDSSFQNFGPRLGAAYSISPRTVVRAGWGLFYDGFVYDPGSSGFSQTTNSILFSPTYVVQNLIDNPFPTGLIPATGSKLGLKTNVGTSVSFVAPQAREPRAQQFNFNVQHQLPRNILVMVGYNYNGIARLPVNLNLNHLTLAQIQQGTTYLSTAVTNPFAGLVPGYSLNSATTGQSQLLLPYPEFTSVSENDIPIGNSSYHALEVQVTKRWSDGLSFTAAYTNSRHEGRYSYMNAFDTQLMKEVDPYDIPQMVSLNGAYEFPLGRGKPFGSNLPGWMDKIVGGWQINWMIRFQDGTPWQFSSNTAPVPGVNPHYSPQSLNQWVNPNAFQNVTNTAFCYPQGSGNCIQEFSTSDPHVRLPGTANYDLSVFKSFRITERVKFVFMNNWVNATNTPQWWTAYGCNSITSPCFGKIAGQTDQSNYARQIQIAGRLTF